MPGLSSELYNLCRTTLLNCSEFESQQSLKAVFVTTELGFCRDGLPEAASKEDRVDKTLAYLLGERLSDGQPVLPLFLATLRDRCSEADALRAELEKCFFAVSQELGNISSQSRPKWSILDQLFIQAGIPPTMPLHEKIGNLLMISLGQISQDTFAVVFYLIALLVLGGMFAWGLVQYESDWAEAPWQFGAIIWLGLTILPLLAGSLPQQREKELLTKFSTRQRLALRLEKAFGIYISAYLGIMATILVLLGLYYIGLWTHLSATFKLIFWIVMVWLTFILSFVGAVIATKYLENLLKENRQIKLSPNHFLLALGFPLIVYPFLMIFGFLTLPLWQNPLFGVPLIAFGFLFLAWNLRRKD